MNNSEDKTTSLIEIRNYKAIKSNTLIQDAMFELSTQELKIIIFLVSKIRIGDENFPTYIFKISEFCEICGINVQSGKTYNNIRNALKKLTERSIWVKNKQYETWLRWIDSPKFFPGTGTIHIKFSQDMKPFLLNLKENFTAVSLYHVLPMRSQYSIRLYELLLSFQYKKSFTLKIEDFKELVGVKNTMDFRDVKRRVLDVAIQELEKYSDLVVSYELIKEWRTCTHIKFSVATKKDTEERLRTFSNIEGAISKGKLNKFALMLGENKGEDAPEI